LVRRIATEIEGHLVELGSDGRLIHLQTEELSAGVGETLTLVLRDYADALAPEHLRSLTHDAVMDLPQVVAALNLPAPNDQLHDELAARGYRLLHRLPQLSGVLVDRLVDRFGSLPEIMSASAAELESVEGIGAATARVVRDGLARLVEASIFERYE
jgi:diadenylate cyclase